jgi:hypothetical protein
MKIEMGVVEIYDDFLSEEQAKQIIESAEEIDSDDSFPMGFVDAHIGKGHKGGEIRSNQLFNITNYAHTNPQSREYREAVKSGKDNYFSDLKNMQSLIASGLQKYVGEYTQKYEFPIMFDEGYTLLRYKGGQEYKGHSDYAPHIPRYLSALILLNPQEYEGGGTYFEHFDVTIKPDKPSLVLFPSNYAYTHRAMPVISGTKYAIVTWLGHQIDFDGMPPMYTGE